LASKAHKHKVAMWCSHSDRNVSRSRLNGHPISMCGWHNSNGKLFHSRGSTTKKLLSPRHVLVC